MAFHAYRTTGTPKGVEISHYNAVANSIQLVAKRSMVDDTETARARRARLDIIGERWLAPLPMYHAYVSIWQSVPKSSEVI